jgi:hypothetical protein
MTIQQASRMLNEVENQLGEEFVRRYYFTLKTEERADGIPQVVEALLRDAGNGFLVATFPVNDATTAEELADVIRRWLEGKGGESA